MPSSEELRNGAAAERSPEVHRGGQRAHLADPKGNERIAGKVEKKVDQQEGRVQPRLRNDRSAHPVSINPQTLRHHKLVEQTGGKDIDRFDKTAEPELGNGLAVDLEVLRVQDRSDRPPTCETETGNQTGQPDPTDAPRPPR